MFSSQNRIGFSTAMASNLTNQSRNVLSKKLMANEEVTTLLIETLAMYSVKNMTYHLKHVSDRKLWTISISTQL